VHITALTGFVYFTVFHAQISRFCELTSNNASNLYSRVAMNPQPTSAAGIKDQAEQVSDSAYPMTHYAPVDARGLALGILATVSLVFALDWMQTFLIPLLLGILLAYTLSPLVAALQRIRIPRVLATSIVMTAVICTIVVGAYSLRTQMQTIIAQLPDVASKLTGGIASMRDLPGENMQNVQFAMGEIEKATSQVASVSPGLNQRPTHVVIDTPGFKLGDFMWAQSMGALGFAGETAMAMFLVFFLLAGGDTFKRKLVRITGPSLSKRKITVAILDDINASIQKYMFMLLVTNVLVGLLMWLAFRWIGLENAGAWAVTAALLHVIPYLGPLAIAAATGMAAYMQFDSFIMALLVSGASLAIATLIGIFATTWMTGKIARMNAAAVFIALLFWAWLWGIWGMLLGIPIIVILKVVSQHVEQLQSVAELLGE
jgi:predicted PurR-regulated permease PerM